MDSSSGFWINAYSLVTICAMVGLLAGVARRIMAAPVGWVRAGVVSMLAAFAGGSLIQAMYDENPAFGDLVVGGIPRGADLAVVLAVLVLVFVGTFVAGLAVLLILEVLVPTGSVPSPWRLLRNARRRWRETRRYVQILGVFARRGVSQGMQRGTRLRRLSADDQQRLAEALVEALSAAGVTFVKFGQMLSTRRDLLPTSIADALASLQTDVPPEPWARIEAVLERSLGMAPDDAFAEFDPEPLASASVGQVHAARLADGTRVVVKVQRPGARAQVEGDLEILARLARRAGREEWGAALGIVDLAEGFAESLREELDYTVELENTVALRAALGQDGPLGVDSPRDGAEPVEVRVPRVYPALSGPTVLVLERLDGVAVGSAAVHLAKLSAERRHAMATRLLASTLEQLLVVGLFHSDMHPGNVLVTGAGDLGLLDFGSVGRLADTERLSLGAVLLAVDADDSVAGTRAILGLLDAPPDLDRRALERAVGHIMVRFRSAGTGGGATDSMFTALFRLVTEMRLAIPGQVGSAFRTITTLEGTLRHLDPDFGIVEEARRLAGPLMSRLASPGMLARRALAQAVAAAPEIERLPGRLADLSNDIAEGRLTVRVQPFADPESRGFVAGLARQAVIAVVTAACLLGAVLLLVSDSGPVLPGGIGLYGLVGTAFGLLGVALGVRVCVFALGAGRRRER